MPTDSSYSRLTDAWNTGGSSRAVALARAGVQALIRHSGLQAKPDPYQVIWVREPGVPTCPPAVISIAQPRCNYRIEQVMPESAQQIESLLRERRPRMLVTDVDWCAHIGASAVRHLHRHAPGTDWILCWDAASPRWLDTLLQSGARGAVLSNDSDTALARAFDAVLAGELWLSRQVMQWLYASVTELPSQEPASSMPASVWGAESELTVREAEVVELMRHGLTNREIGERLGVSINTVKKHLANAFEKRGIRSRRQTLV